MAYMTRTAQGAPCWVSLLTRDLAAAQHFYGALLGWTFRPGSQRLGPYVVAMADGVPVAGVGATSQVGMPASWTAYFHADSADTVAERVRERGATVAVGPVPFGRGRVAWAADPAGAVFGIWEGDSDPGWHSGTLAGSPAWIELRTGDAFAAAIFYGEVFGWDNDNDNDTDADTDADTGAEGAGKPGRCDVCYEHDRVLLRIDGKTAAGLRGGVSTPDPKIRSRWQVYFAVDDVDSVARHAVALGGSVEAPPGDSPYGRVATLRDFEGGLFSVTAREV